MSAPEAGQAGADEGSIEEAMADVRLDRILADAARLIAAPSENPGAGEGPAVEALAELCRELGAEVMLGEVAPGRMNLHATICGERSGAPIMFLGHSDVVPAGEGWSGDPFVPRIEGGRLIGRGATDMKGGLAAVLEAMRVLAELEIDHPIELLVTVDEEDRATGVLHYLQHAADRELLALVVAEPTDLDTIVGCRGAANLRLEISGRAAHAGRPSDGASAIDAACRIVGLIGEEAERFEREAEGDWWRPTWNVGRIQGGHGTSIVADRCALDLDRRLMPEESTDRILEGLLARIADSDAIREGIAVTGAVDMSMPGFLVDEGSMLPRLAREAVERAGGASRIDRWTAACEGGFLARRHGVPTIILGPGEITTQAHQPDESVRIDDLGIAARAYVALALELAAAADADRDLGDAPRVPPWRRRMSRATATPVGLPERG